MKIFDYIFAAKIITTIMKQFRSARLWIFFALIVIKLQSISVSSQSISYSYDQAGNRIARRVINLPPAPAKVTSNAADSVNVTEEISTFTIRIYPNPTRGALMIEMQGLDDREDSAKLLLYSNQGILTHSLQAQNGLNPVDMTPLPAGWYILRIQGKQQI